ncbi:MAG: hypothetical protein BGO32_04305 [Bacteroidetes bacterium 37-13]|nr:MAG: hypothetical protein BGO32_04305 [Bacteroidetes bacterium 37-13]
MIFLNAISDSGRLVQLQIKTMLQLSPSKLMLKSNAEIVESLNVKKIPKSETYGNYCIIAIKLSKR